MKRLLLLTLFLFPLFASAAVRAVPGSYTTIQAAIIASVNGDTVLVERGTYFENINYRGRNIVVMSRYGLTHDITDIIGTVINGSKPVNADSASVVLFINHEDSSAVLMGFTITGGKGTAWPDEHSAGTFIEGGGILAAFASPRILHNLIINNEAVTTRNGIISAGGGGIRVGDGNPTIANNVIMNNRGRYGAGVVANYTGVIIRNNIIVGNVGGGDYGGGGIWLNGPGPKPKFIENNTIIGNQSLSDGGGLLFYDNTATAAVRNNILWGNIAVSAPQVSLREGAVMDATFNDIQGGAVGNGNITVAPGFVDSLLLSVASPLVDAGDTSAAYRDAASGATAVFPSRGTSRNDIGAYGGPFASSLSVVQTAKVAFSRTAVNFGKVRPDSIVMVSIRLSDLGTLSVSVDSVRLRYNTPKNLTLSRSSVFSLGIATSDSIVVQWTPSSAQLLNDTLLIYHTDTSQLRPFKVPLSGKAFIIAKPAAGKLYAGSGTADSAKLYLLDTSTAAVSLLGKTGFSQIVSMRTDPKSGELFALVNSATPQLMRISATDAESFPLPQLALTNPKGMVFRPDGTLLIGTFTGSFYAANITTGAVASVGTNGLRISGLAFHPKNGSLWMSVRPPGAGKDNLYKVDPATFQATLIGTSGFGVPTKDITFDENGRLFGVMDTAGAQSYLFRIDTVNGKGTVLGGLSVKGIETIELRSSFVTSVNTGRTPPPEAFELAQNYPNPFNPETAIRYQLSANAQTTLIVYDIIGRAVATLVNGMQSAGSYSVRFDGNGLASGVYIAKLQSGSDVRIRKMLLIK